jgi:hypothetical protein
MKVADPTYGAGTLRPTTRPAGSVCSIPATVTQMNLLRPFEPRLVISPMLSSEKAEQVLQTAEEEFKSGLGVVKVIGTGLGVQKDLHPVYWKLFPFLGKT